MKRSSAGFQIMTSAESPWSSAPLDRSDRFIAVGLGFSAGDDVIDWIQELARKHGVVMLDPQDGTVYRPD
jgi:hypothetical protein